MLTYAMNGDFGQVRHCRSCITKNAPPTPFQFITGGWHRCGELYHISRPQSIGNYLLFFTLTPGGRVRIGEGPWVEIPPSSISILPPNIPHEYCTAPGNWWEFYWLSIQPENDAALKYLYSQSGYVFSLPRVPQMGALIENLFPERFSTDDVHYTITASQTISQIIHMMLEDTFCRDGTARSNSVVQHVIARIESDYHRKLCIEDLARDNYLSEQHLIRLFRSATGYTPYEYLKKYRLMKAQQLLAYSDLSLAEVALQTGFSSTNNFIYQFRQEWGMPPGKYRSVNR